MEVNEISKYVKITNQKKKKKPWETSAFHGYIKKNMKNELNINGQKCGRRTKTEKVKVIKGGKNFNRDSGQKHYKLQGS